MNIECYLWIHFLKYCNVDCKVGLRYEYPVILLTKLWVHKAATNVDTKFNCYFSLRNKNIFSWDSTCKCSSGLSSCSRQDDVTIKTQLTSASQTLFRLGARAWCSGTKMDVVHTQLGKGNNYQEISGKFGVVASTAYKKVNTAESRFLETLSNSNQLSFPFYLPHSNTNFTPDFSNPRLFETPANLN